MRMDLPLLSALFVAMALAFYVMFDGFDLGVGALLLLQLDETLRDRMVDSITPTWDGNETWLIMAGVGLLAAFPIAYGVLLPAFYLPLIAMLLALGLRGVSFEFRAQTISGRRLWDGVFGAGSVIAALMQGLVVGGLIQGVGVHGERFTGDVLDIFRPFTILVAFAVLTGYVVLGGGWLHLKATAGLRGFSERVLRIATVAFAATSVAVCLAAATVQTGVARAWITHAWPLALISVLFLGGVAALLRTIGSRHDGLPFALGLGLFGLGLAGLGLAIFPDIVPFRLSLWAAAASIQSQNLLLAGASIVTPVVLTYSAFAYWVFRGKTPADGWES